MKVFRSARRLVADVERVLRSSRPSFGDSPLQEVVDLLCSGRHYAWVGIFLAVGENQAQKLASAGSDAPTQVALPETHSKILISIRLASREIGILSAESGDERGLSVLDRVLLERVADALARFLAGRGKYLVRRARQKTDVGSQRPQARSAQP